MPITRKAAPSGAMCGTSARMGPAQTASTGAASFCSSQARPSELVLPWRWQQQLMPPHPCQPRQMLVHQQVKTLPSCLQDECTAPRPLSCFCRQPRCTDQAGQPTVRHICALLDKWPQRRHETSLHLVCSSWCRRGHTGATVCRCPAEDCPPSGAERWAQCARASYRRRSRGWMAPGQVCRPCRP